MKKFGAAVFHFICGHKVLFALLFVAILSGIAINTSFKPQQKKQMDPAPESQQQPQKSAIFILKKVDLGKDEEISATAQGLLPHIVKTAQKGKITAVYAKVGDRVKAADKLCKLDTGELDLEIAETEKAIALAAEKDALKLSQARRKLADAEEKQRLDEIYYAGLVLKAKDDVNTAHALNAKNTADQTVSDLPVQAAREVVRITQAEYDRLVFLMQDPLLPENAAELADLTLSPEEELNARRVRLETAVTNLDQLILDYQVAWQNAYDSAMALPLPEKEKAEHEKAIKAQETSQRENRIKVQDAKDDVDTYLLNDTAASLRAELNSLVKKKADAVITAPVDGTITAADAKIGVMAEGLELFVIEREEKLCLVAYVKNEDAPVFAAKSPVQINCLQLENAVWQGFATAEQEREHVKITVEFESYPKDFLPGMQAQIVLQQNKGQDIFEVPSGAIFKNPQGQSVVYHHFAPQGQNSLPQAANFVREIVVTELEKTHTYTRISSPELTDGMEILMG